MLYLGIDGGGTKTLFRLCDEKLNLIKEIKLSTCHFGQVGFDGLERILLEGITTVLAGLEEDVIISYGLAGYGQVLDIRTKIEQVVKRVSAHHKYYLHNDSQIAALGALNGQKGIVMIAGTGSIAIAYDKVNWYRRGGWGYLIDDAGSGYDIGKKGLRLFARMSENLIPRDAFYNLMMDHFKLDNDTDLIKVMFDSNSEIRTKTASIASIVAQGAYANSKGCLKIYEEIAFEHAILINSLKELFNEDIIISYIGGVFNAGAILLENYQKLQINLVAPQHDSCNGAILLAQNLENAD